MLGGWPGSWPCLSVVQTSGGVPSPTTVPALVKGMMAQGKMMSDTTWSHGAALTLCWLPVVSEIFLIDAKLILFFLNLQMTSFWKALC